jgi:hypothetical protein
MPGGWLRDRGTFHRTGPSRTPSREPVAARCTGWPACAASARFHRCTKTPARPLLAPLSRDESRPRAPLRLLQVDVPTSTTTDHSSISIRGNRGRDDCLKLDRKSPSDTKQPPELLRVRGRAIRCPTFPLAIARAGDFAPTPIAPGTCCRETPSPAGLERHGEVVTLPTPSTLARGARREGGVAPGIREETQR